MKLLLHTCCAPCLMHPLERLKEKGFAVAGFFYNPNIHPVSEYEKRRQAVEEFNKSLGIQIIYPQYSPLDFFWEVNPRTKDFGAGVNLHPDRPQRCSLCWSVRLKMTARLAKEINFTHFSTTLLVSPYQDQEVLKRIGADISRQEGIDFYDEDFRGGFREAHNRAKAQGIYCQKYCGCIYSEVETCRDSQRH